MKTVQDVLREYHSLPHEFQLEYGYPEFHKIAAFCQMESWYMSETDRFQDALTKVFLPGATWICTDTQVGIAIYCLYQRPVIISFQSARKNDEEMYFLSESDANLVRSFMEGFLVPPDWPVIKMEEPIADDWFCSDD